MMEIFEHLHPKLVHFPIAFFVGAWIFLVISQLFKKEQIFKAAIYAYYMAALFSLPSAVSGLLEAEELHLSHPILYAHRNYAIALIIVSFVGLLLMWIRRKDVQAQRITFILSCWVCVLLVAMAGYYGGEMVYEYGIGVSR